MPKHFKLSEIDELALGEITRHLQEESQGGDVYMTQAEARHILVARLGMTEEEAQDFLVHLPVSDEESGKDG